MKSRFMQVDVFTDVPFMGNPLAVILDAGGLSGEQMQAIARWTNLSETVFVLPPDDSAADYRVRIFTTEEELPFAGHPTLGTAYALLQTGLVPKRPGVLTQQCGVGLVSIRLEDDGALGFSVPSAKVTQIVEGSHPQLAAALLDAGITHYDDLSVIDIGIRWLVARLDSAKACLDWVPETAAMELLQRCAGVNGIAVYAEHADGAPADFEVRAFTVEHGVLIEDPVTGSANAGIASLLQAKGRLLPYTVRQGTVLGRDGRVSVSYVDEIPWISGKVVTVVSGEIQL